LIFGNPLAAYMLGRSHLDTAKDPSLHMRLRQKQKVRKSKGCTKAKDAQKQRVRFIFFLLILQAHLAGSVAF
jgi:hypothetical protein